MRASVTKRCSVVACAVLLGAALSGCAVVAVTSAAISVTASVVELTADAAVGTARIVGKGVGKAADAMLDDDPPAPAPAAASMPVVAPVAVVRPSAPVQVGQPYRGSRLDSLQPQTLYPMDDAGTLP